MTKTTDEMRRLAALADTILVLEGFTIGMEAELHELEVVGRDLQEAMKKSNDLASAERLIEAMTDARERVGLLCSDAVLCRKLASTPNLRKGTDGGPRTESTSRC